MTSTIQATSHHHTRNLRGRQGLSGLVDRPTHDTPNGPGKIPDENEGTSSAFLADASQRIDSILAQGPVAVLDTLLQCRDGGLRLLP